MANQQWNPETTDRGWHWLRRRDNLEWRLAFRDRLGVGWRVSDVIGRTVAMSLNKAVAKPLGFLDGFPIHRGLGARHLGDGGL